MTALLALAGCRAAPMAGPPNGARPNVILIMTDDQGYGDLGCTGNPHIKTPNLDRLCREGVRFDRFHVSPVCSPTRASLLTGRYNYRTGIVDTYLGRSMMRPDEITLAQILASHGYRTGIFGKWHLGDHYPLRPMDRGFAESLVHKDGGLAQLSAPPGSGYFDPILYRNGREEKVPGYCTDIFGAEAVQFVRQNRDRPFFLYLATNAPHTPLEIADEYVKPYRAMGLDEETARVYGMVTNIDENVGRLLATLRELGIDENTLVIFLTDNGPAFGPRRPRYNAGMRGTKGTVYDGGIRVPFFVRWPARLPAGAVVYRIAAHIDVLPTVLEACGAPVPAGLRLDGRSLMPLLRGQEAGWPARTLFFQWHRGDAPEPFRNAAVRTDRYKLVDGKELYDMIADPAEKHDIAAAHPDIVARLRAEYEAWLRDVSAPHHFAPVRNLVGTPHENPVRLTRQDWRSARNWGDQDLGHWEITVASAGAYRITLRFPTTPSPESAHLRIGAAAGERALGPGAADCVFEGVRLPVGDARLEAWLASGGRRVGPRWVDVERID